MKGILLRVGIDKSAGHMNAPFDPESGQFVYLPIPERHPFKDGLEVRYDQFEEPLRALSERAELRKSTELPSHLKGAGCHLDPDFSHLTYGDQGNRGRIIKKLEKGDFIAFFASLRPLRSCRESLCYGLIGIFTVDRVCRVRDMPMQDFHRNAHTRRLSPNPKDIIVFGDPKSSGRFDRCIPIGARRNAAYRVTEECLDSWGGLEVKDGYIQRSVNPPFFTQPRTFREWLDCQAPTLRHSNN